jgi:tetratricopeptide (TPR) repeat protein
MQGLVAELARIKQQQGGMMPVLPAAGAGIQALHAAIMQHMQAQQREPAALRLDELIAHPQADANSMLFAAQIANQLGDFGRVEKALARLVQMTPDNVEAWFDLAGIRALINQPTEAVAALRESLKRSAQRLSTNPAAPNLYSNALTDTRFNNLRQLPEFQQLIAEHQRAGK